MRKGGNPNRWVFRASGCEGAEALLLHAAACIQRGVLPDSGCGKVEEALLCVRGFV